MAVHDIDMDPVSTGMIHSTDLLAELGEIGSEDRGGDDERARHVLVPNSRCRSPNTLPRLGQTTL